MDIILQSPLYYNKKNLYYCDFSLAFKLFDVIV